MCVVLINRYSKCVCKATQNVRIKKILKIEYLIQYQRRRKYIHISFASNVP